LLEEARSLAGAVGPPVPSGDVDVTAGVTPAAAGRMLSLSEHAVRRQLREGRLEGKKVNGRWQIRGT
jgi:hypothetical protein